MVHYQKTQGGFLEVFFSAKRQGDSAQGAHLLHAKLPHISDTRTVKHMGARQSGGRRIRQLFQANEAMFSRIS